MDLRTSLAAKAGEGNGEAWSFAESEGALLVRNRLAFIDRTRSLPYSALLKLGRSVQGSGGAQISTQPFTLNELARFHTSCSPVANAEMAAVSSYRGLDIANLTGGRFAIVLRRLSTRDRAIVVQQLDSVGRCDVPMRTFSDRDIQEILAALRANSLVTEDGSGDCTMIPGFARILWSGALRLERDDAGLAVTLRATVPDLGEFDSVSTRIATDLRP
jgi:hypothetical protein